MEIGRAGRDGHPAHCILLFDRADLEIQEQLQALSRPSVRHLEKLENALTAWKSEERAPTPETLAYSAGVPARICQVLLSDLEEAGLVERNQNGGITIVVPHESFKGGVRDVVAKLKTFRYEVSGVSGWLPTTPNRRNAGACLSGGTSERSTRHGAGPATGAAPRALQPRPL